MKVPGYCAACDVIFLGPMDREIGSRFIGETNIIANCPVCYAQVRLSGSNNFSSLALVNLLLDSSISPQVKQSIAIYLVNIAKKKSTLGDLYRFSRRKGKKVFDLVTALNLAGVAAGILIGIASLLMTYSSSLDQAEQFKKTHQIEVDQRDILAEILEIDEAKGYEGYNIVPVPPPRPVANKNSNMESQNANDGPNRKARRKAQALVRKSKN